MTSPLDELIKKSKELEAYRPDCGDNSCAFMVEKGGMRTNGGCRCIRDLTGDPRARAYFRGIANTHATLVKLVEVYREALIKFADLGMEPKRVAWPANVYMANARHALELGEKIAMGGE